MCLRGRTITIEGSGEECVRWTKAAQGSVVWVSVVHEGPKTLGGFKVVRASSNVKSRYLLGYCRKHKPRSIHVYMMFTYRSNAEKDDDVQGTWL
jgi:hypothetical protein